MKTLASWGELPGFVASSASMRELLALTQRLAAARSAVLLQGESGTGKDLVAHWLHYAGPRREGPFLKIHCPSIPTELLESELFGYEKGAFTDARQAKPGKLEIADGGSVYLDQVHDLPLALQAKLLRVVEERRFERLGGSRTLEVDIRFVASSNVSLKELVAGGRFREDLFHRLNVVPLHLAPLRERREDVLPLARFFLERDRGTGRARGLDAEAEALLLAYDWPGNVRELRSAVEAAVLGGHEEVVGAAALPVAISHFGGHLAVSSRRRPTLREVEESYVRAVLREEEDHQSRAAAVLGVSRKALWQMRRRYGIP